MYKHSLSLFTGAKNSETFYHFVSLTTKAENKSQPLHRFEENVALYKHFTSTKALGHHVTKCILFR